MRGRKTEQVSMLILGNVEAMIPREHPLRGIKDLADAALRRMNATFNAMYADSGRDSIPPERLLKGQLLIALYSVRSERQLCEQLQYNILFRWFLDMDMTSGVFDHSVFSKNRDRLLKHDVTHEFFSEVVLAAKKNGLMSAEHFSVDGTLIEAWASLKSFRPKGEKKDSDDNNPPAAGNPSNRWVDFHGEKRSNETHESKTDPEAKLMRKGWGKEAKLSFSAHVLSENRNGLVVNIVVEEANGTAERSAALKMLDELDRAPTDPITVGADKGYDTQDFVGDCRERNVTPHVAQNNKGRRSAIDGRTTRHAGYSISQRLRMRIEEIFGWGKTIGGLRKTMLRGKIKNQMRAYLIGAAYNLVRMTKLLKPDVVRP
jgi:transposase